MSVVLLKNHDDDDDNSMLLDISESALSQRRIDHRYDMVSCTLTYSSTKTSVR